MINSEDFKIWLNDPCTKFLQQWIEKDRDTLKKSAMEHIYSRFYSPNVFEISARSFGNCNGLDRILELFKWSKEQVIEEIKAKDLPEGAEMPKIDDYIGEQIEFVYSKGDQDGENN